MTASNVIPATVAIAVICFLIESWSERYDDTFIRRMSIIQWVVIAILVTAASLAIYSRWQSVATVHVAAATLTYAGSQFGRRIISQLKQRKVRRLQRRARQEVR